MDAIYVDLDGTLVTLESSFPAVVEDAAARVDGDAPPDLVQRYGSALSEALNGADDPYAAAVRAADLPFDPDAFSFAMHEAEVGATSTLGDPESALAALGEDHRLGVLTNGHGPLQRAKLVSCGLADHFEAVVVSDDVGAGKPDPGIFAAAERRLPADEYAFVADALDRDVRAAVDVGWRGIYLGDEDPDDVPSVASLADVPDVL